MNDTYSPERGLASPGAQRRLSKARSSSDLARRALLLLAGGMATTAICWVAAQLVARDVPAKVRVAYALVSGATFVAYFVCAALIKPAERPELQDEESDPPED